MQKNAHISRLDRPGLKNKKREIEDILYCNSINILCVQEVEIEKLFDSDLLSNKGYVFEKQSSLVHY